MSRTSADLKTALDGLKWKSARRIRKLLASEGYTGIPGKYASCPLSAYLSDRVGSHVDVFELVAEQGRSQLAAEIPGSHSKIFLPIGAARFVANFDAGRYPELIRA